MPIHLTDFWTRFQSGIEVAVLGSSPDKLLGVRDGFLRYFHDGLDRPIPVAVRPQPGKGGMTSSLTRGLETQRTAVALSTLYAISTLFYGILESRPVRRRPWR